MNTTIVKKNTFYPCEIRLDLFLSHMRLVHKYTKNKQALHCQIDNTTLRHIELTNGCTIDTLLKLCKAYKMQAWVLLKYAYDLDPRNNG